MPNYNKMLPVMMACDIWSQNLPSSVKPLLVGMPILWFGDVNAYFDSPKKVVTIGINPSDKEFPTFSTSRFGAVTTMSNNGSYRPYFDALNQYFITNPYQAWFKHFEKVLNQHQINATYGGNMAPTPAKFPNTAIHIDFHSPLATSPTWRKLSQSQKKEISNSGLFVDLLRLLHPDYIIVSLSKMNVGNLLTVINNASSLLSSPLIPHKSFTLNKTSSKCTILKGMNYGTFAAGAKRLVWGRNFNGTPYGGISTTDLQIILSNILP